MTIIQSIIIKLADGREFGIDCTQAMVAQIDLDMMWQPPPPDTAPDSFEDFALAMRPRPRLLIEILLLPPGAEEMSGLITFMRAIQDAENNS